MMGDEGISERQENEVEALKAIYEGDFEDLRLKDVWKVARPPEFLIRLGPNCDSYGMQQPVICQANLHVKCGTNYPSSPPTFIRIHEPRGISEPQLEELTRKIESMMHELRGQELAMPVAQNVSAWLSDYNKLALTRANGNKSLLSEIVQEKVEKRDRIEIEERAAIMEEIEQTAEAIKEEKIRLKEKRWSTESALEEDCRKEVAVSKKSRHRTISSAMPEATGFTVDGNWSGVETASFNFKGEKVTVDKVSQIGANKLGGVVYFGIVRSNGKLVAISEWNFAIRRSKAVSKKVAFSDAAAAADVRIHDETSLYKQLSVIEQEMSSIQRLCQHPNVVPYLGISYHKCNSGQTVRVHVFEEFVRGSSLSVYLRENLPVDLATLRYFSASILEALHFMHSHNIVHRDLRDTSVCLESTGCVRVGDFSIDRRLKELVAPDCEERFPLTVGRGGKKCDVFRLGVLILSLFAGEIGQDAVIPRAVRCCEFKSFLKMCLTRDEHERWSAAELLEHNWIKTRIEKSSLRRQANDACGAGASFDQSSEPDAPDQPPAVPFTLVGSGQSRLQSEFSVIDSIGKGGFGEVFKVKNNLDGQIYAIKRIQLNSKNSQVTKKILREVKLLSRLHHENVVRYYHSWIEVMEANSLPEISDQQSGFSSAQLDDDEKAKKSLIGSLLLTPKRTSSPINLDASASEWSFSHFVPEDDDDEDDDDDDDDESDDDNVFGTSFLPSANLHNYDEEDSVIVFMNSGDEENSSKEGADSSSPGRRIPPSHGKSAAADDDDDDANKEEEESGRKSVHQLQFMYIQMEYCDKQTLRSAIDQDDLYKTPNRVWKMFREIVEGLVHIHSQGMIHRDLKPVNIFIDSQDQVKIGDFGLATTRIVGGKTNEDVVDPNNESVVNQDLTGQVGTAMYVAPEISSAAAVNLSYNQKVDIYSLGVIFFEMFHPPLTTGMERIKVLTELRSEEINLDNAAQDVLTDGQKRILNWLLNHDPCKRPTSLEILQSSYLPPPQVEEAELQDAVGRTLANPKSKAYRHLVDACLGQRTKVARDITYDMDVPKSAVHRKTLQSREYVRRSAEKVFHRHGAVFFQSPQLMPKGNLGIYKKTDSLVQVMSRSGRVVSLPFDLRVPFVRFVARAGVVGFVKRYCIAPVFRESRVYDIQPKEMVECAFDIIHPTEGYLISDAEVLVVVDEILREVQPVANVTYYYRLNHTVLLKGILLHYGIDEENHGEIYNIIRDTERCSKQQRIDKLADLNITEQVAEALLHTLEKEASLSQIGSILKAVVRRKNEAAGHVKHGLRELETIVGHCHEMGIRCEIVIAPSLVYHPDLFQGMVCQLVRRKKNNQNERIVAAGGRYDQLIRDFNSKFNFGKKSAAAMEPHGREQCGVGISIQLDQIANVVSHQQLLTRFSVVNVVVYAQQQTVPATSRKLEIAKWLWACGVHCTVSETETTMEEVQEWAQDAGASLIVIVLDADDHVRVRCLTEKDRFVEKKVPTRDLVEYVQNQLLGDSSSVAAADVKAGAAAAAAMEPNRPTSSALLSNVNFNYRFMDKKSIAAKKRAVTAKISSSLQSLSVGVHVEVFILPFPSNVIKSLSCYLDFDEEDSFKESVRTMAEKHSRYKKYLAELCDELFTLRFVKNRSVFIFYSVDNNVFRTILM